MNFQLLTPFLLLGVALAADYRIHLGISQITGQVGAGFDPNRIVPTAGDTITFSWEIPAYIQNPPTGSYSATQGTFENPCTPMSGGFDSGPRTTAPESTGQASTVVFTVRDDKPLYFFSSVGEQCKGGMVLGVNSPAIGSGSVESYILAAGGDPNAAPLSPNSTTTSPNSTTTSPAPSSNTTAPRNQTSTPSSNSAKPVTSTSSTTNATSAKPQNGAGVLNLPHAALVFMGLLTASFSF